jgi:hypothetical protein
MVTKEVKLNEVIDKVRKLRQSLEMQRENMQLILLREEKQLLGQTIKEIQEVRKRLEATQILKEVELKRRFEYMGRQSDT